MNNYMAAYTNDPVWSAKPFNDSLPIITVTNAFYRFWTGGTISVLSSGAVQTKCCKDEQNLGGEFFSLSF